METTTGSYFWFVSSACIGGFIVLVGICMEVLADKKWFKSIKAFRLWESVKLGGGILVIVGIAIEVVVAFLTSVYEWQNAPLNRPIATISATAFLTIRLDHKILEPSSDNDWRSGISFFIGTNSDEAQQLFCLEADKNDVESGTIVGTNCVLFTIKLHQSPPYPGFPPERGLDMPVKAFDNVGCFVFSMPQISNAEIVSGSVIVTLNSSSVWTFDIPPQKQGYGFITAKKVQTAANKFEMQVLPIQILNQQTKETNFFDGK